MGDPRETLGAVLLKSGMYTAPVAAELADQQMEALTAAGYVLLSPKEAEQERDLERLATAAGMRAGR